MSTQLPVGNPAEYSANSAQPGELALPLPSDEGSERARPDTREFPLLEQAYQAFLRDLPELLRDHPDTFVAYQGNNRLGICESPWPLEDLVGALPPGTATVFNIGPVSEIDQGAEAGPLF